MNEKLWSRVVITYVEPQVNGGRWPIRRSVGQSVSVTVGAIVDGHDMLRAECHLVLMDENSGVFPLTLRYNDEYTGCFTPPSIGCYTYRACAWIDRFGTWQEEFARRVKGGAAEPEILVELRTGADLIAEVAELATGADRSALHKAAKALESGHTEPAFEEELLALYRRHDPKTGAAWSDDRLLVVDRKLATFAAWYEFFPRSSGAIGHGTLDDAAARLGGIRKMGFDVVYLPPVHPIGTTFRKGKDNSPAAEAGEPGSPWAIGSGEGGHKSVSSALGGLEAFNRFIKRANELGLAVALDIAFQCSPDHPYVTDHPEWFRKRADGSIRYAENPPKKYQDVYPFDFTCADFPALWEELKSIFEFWIERGVHIFRVDNPHTKPFAFWKWSLDALYKEHPHLIFLAEAFSRPKIMAHLATLGFNNSYTYFTWRNSKAELESYFEELTKSELAEYFRPNLWPNTPDILHDYLAHGGRAAHLVRFALAATLSSVYGVYGPPYEHVVHRQHPDREEYADNEKYEVRIWNWDDPTSLQPFFRRINRIRKENPALHGNRSLQFLPTTNPQIVAYIKAESENIIICVVNLDPRQIQECTVDLAATALPEGFQLHDLVGGERYFPAGTVHFVRLDPNIMPVRIYRVLSRTVTEADFDYYA